MAGARAATRYAKAVLTLASEKHVDDVVNNDMRLITKVISENPALKTLLSNPIVKSTPKKAILLSVFKDLNTITTQLIDLLVTNKRIAILDDIASAYRHHFEIHHGQEQAQVTTAVPMTPDLESKILNKVKTLTEKTITLVPKVDPNILGGFILKVGDKQYDASIANKLNRLKREFTLN